MVLLAPAFLSLAVLVTICLPATSARGEALHKRFSFTGTFRYEPLVGSDISALHLPPEAVPIPVRSRNRRSEPAQAPLPRTLVGTRDLSSGQPFATDDRSTLGVPAREPREMQGPATRGEVRGGVTGAETPAPETREAAATGARAPSSALEDASRASQHTRSVQAAPAEEAGPAVTRSRTRAAPPATSRRYSASSNASGRAPPPTSDTLLAPTPPWASRAFDANR